jgi:hypothetical protein
MVRKEGHRQRGRGQRGFSSDGRQAKEFEVAKGLNYWTLYSFASSLRFQLSYIATANSGVFDLDEHIVCISDLRHRTVFELDLIHAFEHEGEILRRAHDKLCQQRRKSPFERSEGKKEGRGERDFSTFAPAVVVAAVLGAISFILPYSLFGVGGK